MPIPLPFHLTDFVGREDDVAELKHLITTCRLVTLIGIGGIGKTRLALQVAAEVKEQFQDGVWLIEFAALAEPALVPTLVASPFGIREQVGQSLLTALIQTLQSKHLLLVLDNCEHMVAACTTLVASLLQSCAHLQVLATSREALQVTGERLWWVAPLSSPSLTPLPPLEEVLSTEAVRLFCDRARAVNPRFTLTSHNTGVLAQVCQRLDGIPLALELAAARMHMLSVEQLAERLNERFRLLTTGNAAATPRQQTLQATLDWSYALLSPVEQTVLQRLSVFGGSWTLEVIEGICTDERTTPYDMLDVLTQLVNKSLVIAEEYEDAVRYRLLETVQQYAYQQLLEAEGTQRLYMQHWQWYLQFVEHAAAHLHGAQQAQWFQILERKEDNFRLALERSLAAGEITVAARMACALGHFWVTRSHLSEGRYWYEIILAQSQLSAPLRATVLKHAVEILRFQGEYVRVRSLLEERLALQRTLSVSLDHAETLCSLGWTAFYQGDFEEAIRYCQEALLLFQQTKDQPGIAQCLSGLALVATLPLLTEAIMGHEELVRLVDRVLEATTITKELLLAHCEAIPVRRVVEEVLADLNPAEAQAYTICLHIAEQAMVWADPQYLRQVIAHLLSNVFKYVPKQTQISIEISQPAPSSQVCLSVQDAGPGIPPEEMPLLFEKCVRLKRDLAGPIPGMGLGLSICKHLVEAMGGHIWVESSGRKGKGSRFCLTLPPPLLAVASSAGCRTGSQVKVAQI